MSSSVSSTTAPDWLKKLLADGYRIYIASSERILPTLNTRPFGCEAVCYTLENPDHQMFHEAYLLANSLSFRSPDLKMPHWVLIDCVLMQTAIVGLMKPKEMVPENILHYFRSDRYIDFDKVDMIPLSGQIASPAIDGRSLVGISLFSLGRAASGEPGLGLYTKALAFEVHGHERYPLYYGIAQYNNPAIKIHGQFAPEMEIYQAMVPLHPARDMTFIYKTAIDFDPFNLEQNKAVQGVPSFWLDASDIDAKRRIQKGIAEGKRYIIAPPYAVARDESIFLPIIEKEAE